MSHRFQDIDVIDRLGSGDERASSEVFDHYYQALCYFAVRIVKEQALAEDVVLAVFAKLWNRRSDFESMAKLKGFLYTSTRNGCFDVLRQADREEKNKKDLLYLLSEKDDEYFEAEMTRAEVMRRVYAEIERLPEQCRKVLELSVFEGLKTKEIAERLHITVSNVTSQKSRAVQLIRTAILKRKLLFWLGWF